MGVSGRRAHRTKPKVVLRTSQVSQAYFKRAHVGLRYLYVTFIRDIYMC